VPLGVSVTFSTSMSHERFECVIVVGYVQQPYFTAVKLCWYCARSPAM
jgi:hypothetical protein